MTFVLEAHGLRATLEPEMGGLVSELAWRSGDRTYDLFLRPQSIAAKPVFGGVWPLVPFANRAYGGLVSDGVRSWRVPINEPERDCNMHGFGWLARWDIAEAHADRARMRHRRDGSDDPFCYSCDVDIVLEPDRFLANITITNDASESLPYGIGLHPWFEVRPDTRVTLEAAGYLEMGENYRPFGFKETPDGGPFAGGASVQVDHEMAWSLVGWTGACTIRTPSMGLEIVMDASGSMRNPFLYASPHAPFVCIEPYSHGNGAPSEAVARAATPMAVLQQGESLSGWMDLRPRAI